MKVNGYQFIAALAVAFLAAGNAHAQSATGGEAKPDDLLTLARGAVAVSATVDPERVHSLIDGDMASNWNASTKKTPPPYIFVFELAAPARLTHVGIDGAGERPGGVQGGSAGPVLIEGSMTGSAEGFIELARINAEPEGATLAEVPPETQARWLRFTVEGGQATDVSWIYFDEVIAHGEMTPPGGADRFTGIFQTGRVNFLELKQDGTTITGCYVENSGRSTGIVSGAVEDGVARLNWKSEQGITGTALLTRDSTGALAGVRYRQRSRSAWGGPQAPAGSVTPCSDTPPPNPVLQALQDDGEARIYGILFEHDSDVPKSSSTAALRQLFEALEENPALVVQIEGHTDSDGQEDYNQNLSERRAARVVAWLVEQGVGRDRLTSAGKGETEPVATNDTADGKALNRRVDVLRMN